MALYTEEQKVNISKNINFIRMQKGETLAEFGERLNTSRMTVNNWEKREMHLSYQTS
ncbi:helix-turn-helix transcriptional regulator [Streptococcus parauberis]|uniref:helix-turn-helix transcriptional regulator n=1 Tax=Streptococcus parauberis TaxID=1348 RepID=UPI00280BE23E|nr:helix-turn-helix transcriptional regulator [Streptococcus parauberis]WEM65250.1 helix-turn-helix transcriptional regulator [Streptococcus parauberis]